MHTLFFVELVFCVVRRPPLMQFDMRVYVVVTSVDPLRVYLFKDGLVRLATEPYVVPTAKNLAHTRMHLTNYAINKVGIGVHTLSDLYRLCNADA